MPKILADSADIKKIEKLSRYIDLAGITTNPSILAKSDQDLYPLFQDIKSFIGEKYEIHIQTTEDEASKIVMEAKKLREFFGENFHIKIPVTKEGLVAVKLCKEEGIKVTVTAVLSTLQVLAAAKAGADYVAPYVNRMENIGNDANIILTEMQYVLANYDTEILAASFKNEKQLKDVAVMGIDALTADLDLLEKSIWHPYTDKSIEDFKKDWQNKFKNKKVVDYL